MRLRGPFGFGRLRGLLLGAVRSYELPIEHAGCLFIKG